MESQTVMNTYYYSVWFYYRKINTFLVLLMPGGGNHQNQPPSTSLSHTHTIHSEDRLRTFPYTSDQSITTCCKLSKHKNEQAGKPYIPLQYHGRAGCFPQHVHWIWICIPVEWNKTAHKKRKFKFERSYIWFLIKSWKFQSFSEYSLVLKGCWNFGCSQLKCMLNQ